MEIAKQDVMYCEMLYNIRCTALQDVQHSVSYRTGCLMIQVHWNVLLRCSVLQDFLYYRMFYIVGCSVFQHVLYHRMFSTIGCSVLYNVLYYRMFCTLGCSVLQDVLYYRMFCTLGCSVPYNVLYYRMFCTLECFVLQSVLYYRIFGTIGCSVLQDVLQYRIQFHMRQGFVLQDFVYIRMFCVALYPLVSCILYCKNLMCIVVYIWMHCT